MSRQRREARLCLINLGLLTFFFGLMFFLIRVIVAQAAPATDTRTVLHFQGNAEEGCTGDGRTDLVACDGPFLFITSTLSSSPAASWTVPNPATNGTADRNIYDPNWVWNLTGTTTLNGDMTVVWWASCGACGGALNADWYIRVWANGVKKFEKRITAVPALPNVPAQLSTTVSLAQSIVATGTIVLQIDPVYVDAQNNTKIYYDSTVACPGASGSGPCDSYVLMPVLPQGASTPTPTFTPVPTNTPPPAGPGDARFQVYVSPPNMANDAGEPSIGVDWKTGKVMFQSRLSTYRVTFDDCSSPAKATWEDKSAPSSKTSLDPILFVDKDTGRCFVSQLTGENSLSSYSDDDGNNWTLSEGGPGNSGVDHQTIGGGIYHAGFGLPAPAQPYTHAVYYCSQDIATAFCARSDTGSLTYNPGVPIYSIAQCSGLHGHVKVGPDGTVYVPNRNCSSLLGGKQAVVVSEDNGVTWNIRSLPTSVNGNTDPSVGVANDGTIYLGYENGNGTGTGDNHAHIAVSTNKGISWTNDVDVGAPLGIQNIVFPAVVAGDGNRAAFAFIGTTRGGNYQDAAGFADALWYLYIATTYDRGVTWSIVNATPNDPVQRGAICTAGTTCSGNRNLLDFFDATIDKQGRVLVGFADGCINECVNNPPNSGTAKGTIIRQSGGKRMFAANDPAEPAVPSAPLVSATRDLGGVHLGWPVPDSGGSPISAYKIYRGTSSGGETLLATVSTNSYYDTSADPATTYYYRVTAVNAQGEGAYCGETVVDATITVLSDPCTPPGVLVLADTTDNAPNVPPDPRVDIQRLYIGEPYLGDGVNKLVFTLQVMTSTMNSAPPNSQWYIIWTRRSPNANADRNYIAMKSDALGAVAFEVGTVSPPNANLPTKITNTVGSYFPLSGTIVITVDNSLIENVQAGNTMSNLEVRTFFNRADGLPVTQTASNDYSPNGNYTLYGNAYCRPNVAPIAVLSASPQMGAAPLTVYFTGTGSYDPDGNSIPSYTFDFGDGSPPLSTTVSTISHIYTQPGNYMATLIVRDVYGKPSSNVASAVIEVSDTHTRRLYLPLMLKH